MMSTPAVGTPSHLHPRRLSRGVWVAALAEVIVAIVVAAILVWTARPGHSAAGMPGMHYHHSPPVTWTTAFLALAAVAVTVLVWQLVTRARVAAAIAAISLAAVTTTPEVRTIALQSHLCAMIVLEALLVAVPLLALAALPPRATPKSSAKQTFWSVVVVIAVGLNSALLMTLHLPAVHDRGASLTALPASVIPLTAAVGTAYWAAILLTVGRAPHSLRRGALIVGQEVAAVLGLAALIWPPTTMGGSGVLGLSSTLDQRLGGLVMLITCAAVALPMLKRLDAQTPSQQLRTEHDVH